MKHLPINKGVPFCSVDMFELKLNKFPDNQLPPMVKLNDTLLPSQHTFFFFQRSRGKKWRKLSSFGTGGQDDKRTGLLGPCKVYYLRSGHNTRNSSCNKCVVNFFRCIWRLVAQENGKLELLTPNLNSQNTQEPTQLAT